METGERNGANETGLVSVHMSGSGPGVILVPGGLQTAADFKRLADHLATTFTVNVLDRRGRGASRELAPSGGLEAEALDVIRVAEQRQARFVFGLSSGALIALRAAQRAPDVIHAVALYEPPLATPGYERSFDWTEEVSQLIEADEAPAALAHMLGVVGDHPLLRLMPTALLRLVARVALRWGRTADGGRLAELVPTFREDARVVGDARTFLRRATRVEARVLLMSGDRADESLSAALDSLECVIPRSERLVVRRAGHLAAANGGRPGRIAAHLKMFFARLESGEDERSHTRE